MVFREEDEVSEGGEEETDFGFWIEEVGLGIAERRGVPVLQSAIQNPQSAIQNFPALRPLRETPFRLTACPWPGPPW